MDWKYIKPLRSNNLIKELEQLTGYSFPKEYKKCVRHRNGGRPELTRFTTSSGAVHDVKSFLSFNKEDKETMWKAVQWSKEELKDKYIAFAIDNFGNLICFDKHDNAIIYIDTDFSTAELITSSFEKFLAMLN